MEFGCSNFLVRRKVYKKNYLFRGENFAKTIVIFAKVRYNAKVIKALAATVVNANAALKAKNG